MTPHFKTAHEMAEHQLEREVREAVRVQKMTPAERSAWLEANWTPLQQFAAGMYAEVEPDRPPTSRSFATMEEKNRYDEARELERALRFQRRFRTKRNGQA